MAPLTPDDDPQRPPVVVRDPARLEVVTFNLWAGNRHPRRNIRDLADDTGRPHILFLQEAYRWPGTIPGYARYDCPLIGQPGHGQECRSTIALVRKQGVKVHRFKALHVDGPDWRGPKHGHPHDPRTFIDLTVSIKGTRWTRWDCLGVHRTPGGPDPHIKVNGRSWAAEDREIVAWTKRRTNRHPGRPYLITGDHNGRAGDMRPLGIGDLADRLGATAKLRGIDGSLVHGAWSQVVELPGLYGGDGHQPVRTTLTLPYAGRAGA